MGKCLKNGKMKFLKELDPTCRNMSSEPQLQILCKDPAQPNK